MSGDALARMRTLYKLDSEKNPEICHEYEYFFLHVYNCLATLVKLLLQVAASVLPRPMAAGARAGDRIRLSLRPHEILPAHVSASQLITYARYTATT